MVASLPPASSPRRTNLPRNARTVFADDEQRTLAACYAISISLATMWILAVQLAPIVDRSGFVTAERPPVIVDFLPILPRIGNVIPRPSEGGSRAHGTGATVGISSRAGELFGNAGEMVGDALNSLRNVVVTREEERTSSSGKAVLAYGEGGVTSGTPGIEKLGLEKQAGIGTVRGVGLARTQSSLSLPPVVVTATGATGMRNSQALGNSVRSREAQLQNCYEREGLVRNPGLAGSITVALTIAGSGRVSGAQIARRSWVGEGITETENCILAATRAWTFPASAERSAIYEFPLNFTAGR